MSEKQTSRKAVEILMDADKGFRQLRGKEKTRLAAAFARQNRVLYGRAYDLVKCPKNIDFASEKDLRRNLKGIIVYEVKATKKADFSKGIKGYFFDLTTAELLVAQSLGNQFKFAFVDTVRGSYREMGLKELFSNAKKIYPKWAITL